MGNNNKASKQTQKSQNLEIKVSKKKNLEPKSNPSKNSSTYRSIDIETISKTPESSIEIQNLEELIKKQLHELEQINELLTSRTSDLEQNIEKNIQKLKQLESGVSKSSEKAETKLNENNNVPDKVMRKFW